MKNLLIFEVVELSNLYFNIVNIILIKHFTRNYFNYRSRFGIKIIFENNYFLYLSHC